MDIELKCSNEVLRYKENDAKFVGLVCLEESKEVLDVYSDTGIIDEILERIVSSKHKDENSIINDVKDYCHKDLGLPVDEINDDILSTGFDIFFVIDKENKSFIINKNVEIQNSNGGKLLTYKSNGNRFPIVFCQSANPLWSLLFDRLRNIKRNWSYKDLRVGLVLIIIILLIVLLIHYYPISKQVSEEPITKKKYNVELLDSKLDIVDELTTKGRLIINPREGQIIKYLICNQNAAKEGKDINWERIETVISEVDTLYPKRDSQILIFVQEDGDGTYYKKFDFNFCQFIESSFISRTNMPLIKQLFKNTWPEILTIEIGDISEYSGKEVNLDFLAELLESSHDICKIELYQSKDTSIFCPNYPPIKTIYCKENN